MAEAGTDTKEYLTFMAVRVTDRDLNSVLFPVALSACSLPLRAVVFVDPYGWPPPHIPLSRALDPPSYAQLDGYRRILATTTIVAFLAAR